MNIYKYFITLLRLKQKNGVQPKFECDSCEMQVFGVCGAQQNFYVLVFTATLA